MAAERSFKMVRPTPAPPACRPTWRDRLFKPFVAGRTDGTGFTLATARELAAAYGRRLVLRSYGNRLGAAAFALELPQEDAWQPS